jgi:hypothetical protein
MPVARIFTVHPERTVTLTKQLESEGYSVEIVRPESPAAPADLEIDFEVWPEERALYRAAELAERLHADVCVAPGVELGRPDAAKEPATQPKPSQPRQSLHVVSQAPAAELATPEPAEPIQQEQPDPSTVSGPQKEDMSVPPAVWLAAAGPSPEQSQSIEDISAREPEPASTGQQSPKNAFAPVREMAQKAGRALATSWNAARNLAREYKQQLDVRRTEFKAERQQRLLELEKRRTAAKERAKELQAAREAASARLQELLRERGGEPAPAAASELEQASGLSASPAGRDELQTVNAPAVAATSPGTGAWKTRLGAWLAARRGAPAKAIFAGVAAVTALFILGVALASFRSHPPSSSSAEQSGKGVTVKTGGVTLGPSEPAKATGPAAPATTTPRPSPAVRGQNAEVKRPQTHNAAKVTETDFGNDVTVRHFTRKSSRPGSTQNGSDVTIRHVSPRKSKPQAKSTPQTRLKHISDLDD